jgi:site-specific DNA-methyltransferase (adenine-specific)
LHNDRGSAARFFYCAKASKKDRDEGLDGFEEREARSTNWSGDGMPLRQDGTERKQPIARNHHPTVKPTDLMRYLCRLVTPPNGVILDPFLGSGSTGKAAILEGFRFLGFEMEPQYIEIATARIEHAIEQKDKQKTEQENTLFGTNNE